LILRSVTVNRASKGWINGLDEHIDSPRELVGTLFESLEESFAGRPVLRQLEESVFMRQGDYWTICYQGRAAILKATRGLDCLRYPLCHPGRRSGAIRRCPEVWGFQTTQMNRGSKDWK
jgi:hypothetical protein